jgi:hypothetical protein
MVNNSSNIFDMQTNSEVSAKRNKNPTGNLIDDFSDIFGVGATGATNGLKVQNEFGDIFSNLGNIDLSGAAGKNKNNTNSIGVPQDNNSTNIPKPNDLFSSLDAVRKNNLIS